VQCWQTWIPYVRGDVYQLKAPRDARGHEQRGNRYAVVVQSDLLPLSTWLVAPTSTSARPTSFRPEIEIHGKTTYVLVEQTAAVDPERLGEVAGHLARHELAAVDEALRTVLDLNG
jgi:mRNA interferase MazF